jgi:hypothetical protein
MSEPYPLRLKNRYLAGLLAWLVPGLGHLYQGRVKKAILFAVCIHGLFWTGFAQGSWKVVWLRWDRQEQTWAYLAQFGMGAAALPALVNEPAQRRWLPEAIRDFELPPPEETLNELHLKYGKLMDVFVIYTVVAGLLNYFVIYDALAGPALKDEEERELAEQSARVRAAGGSA